MRPSNKSRSRNNKPGNNGNSLNNPNNANNPNNQRRSLGNIINRVFESAGPEGKVRGTPQQIIEKYQALARDAQLSGDRVAAESFLQHSEHYSRLLGEAQREQNEQRSRFEREDNQRADEGSEQPRPQSQPAPQPVTSGLTTIEIEDGDDLRGPIETPEGGRHRATAEAISYDRSSRFEGPSEIVDRATAAEAVPAMNGGNHAAPESTAPLGEQVPEPARRGRPRRKPKDLPPETTAQAD